MHLIDAVERHTKDMLQNGLIEERQSPCMVVAYCVGSEKRLNSEILCGL
jgi:hypothetical protein